MMTVLYIFVAILILGVIVVAHELGHYVAGRLTGMAILEFSVGFGPKLFGFRKGEIDYSLRAIPLGGYCKFLGEDETDADPRAMRNQKVWKRFVTIAAGPVMNFVLAFLAAILLIWCFGSAENAPVIGDLEANMPAVEEGMLQGDVITSVNGEELTFDYEGVEKMVSIIGSSGTSEVSLTVDRGGETLSFVFSPKLASDGTYRIGIILGQAHIRYGFFESVGMSGEYIVFITKTMLDALRSLVTTGAGIQDTMGPVGIIGFVSEEVQRGFDMVLYLIVLISLNLGIMNLIPFPGLDGSRLVFLLVEGVRRKPIDPNKEGWVHAAGLIALFGLVIVVTYRDIVRLFTGG